MNLTIQTVAAVGPSLAPHPDWVSYLVRNSEGRWERSTVWTLPANATVHVTIYNFDGASGLRNPFFGQPQGLVGKEMVDGKPLAAMAPDEPSHTFAIPALGVLALVAPVADDAKNQCGYAPCAMSRRTARSRSRSGPGRRATIAGSASCPVRPASSTASAARCRRSGTWTAS